MQSLATFFEDNKPLAYAAAVAVVIVLIAVLVMLYRLLFGRPLRASTGGRNRQPRLGIVDAYELDRQRQLVLVRRDNVEHLIMIGGPSDVVIESSIVRTQGSSLPRDKDSAGPMVGAVTPPSPALAPAASQGALGAGPQTVALPPAARTDPTLGPRTEPSVAQRLDPVPQPGRAEPSLGPAVPMPSPSVERPPVDRTQQRAIATPDPAAPAVPGPQVDALPPPRNPPPRASSLPGRGPDAQRPQNPVAPVAAVQPVQGANLQGTGGQGQPIQAQATSGPAVQPSALTAAERPAAAPRPALPPRPPVQRPPLPPRPSLSSALPPRPARPLPARADAPRAAEPVRSELPRAEAERSEQAREEAVSRPNQAEAGGSVSDVQAPRAVEPPAPRPETRPAGSPVASKSLETLESLEEEMAKLLGRPTPRRDG